MPFKLRLKKSRQYNVVSKNVFVISVELLDKAVIECTLSADSTGQECLDNVSQRISLSQSEFFGLRFVSKRYGLRWADMEKSLKRQLEKYASESCTLYLAVMFYVSNVAQLFDEVARYQYFLQLKMDIIEGNLACNPDQAVVLAGYGLQAEFGSHDPTRHTAEYLKDFPLLPKHLGAAILMPQVILAHNSLMGLVPAAAEIHYIQRAQQLEGYGVEYFAAKDDAGEEVSLGVSVVGVTTKYPFSQTWQTFVWSNIVNLSNHKRHLVIECDSGVKNSFSQYALEDSDAAKYVWKLCILQHKFYMRTRSFLSAGSQNDATDVDNSNWRSVSMPNLLSYANQNPVFEAVNSNRVAPGAEPLAVSSGGISEVPYKEDEMAAATYNGTMAEVYPHTGAGFSVESVVHQGSLYAHTGVHGQISSSQMNLIQQRMLSSDQLRSLLPTYRPAPDYETAVQQNYGVARVPSHASLSCPLQDHDSPEHLSVAHTYENLLDSFSRVELMQRPVLRSPLAAKTYSHYNNFIDLAHLGDDLDQGLYGVGESALAHQRLSNWISVGPGGGVNLPVQTYSTPELTSQGLAQEAMHDQLTQNFYLLNQFKPPPPYPCVQRSSASTPDLAIQGVACVEAIQMGAARGGSLKSLNQRLLDVLQAPCTNNSSRGSCLAPGKGFGPCSESVTEQRLVMASFNSRHVVNGDYPACHLTLSHDGVRCRSSSTQSAPEVVRAGLTSEEAVVVQQQEDFRVNGVRASSECRRPATLAQQQGKEEGDTETLRKRKGGPELPAAAMNGLGVCFAASMAAPQKDDDRLRSKDGRCQLFESKLAEGSVFLEFEKIQKKRQNGDYSTALLPENATHNRFKDVLPYEDNRVQLSATKDNKSGYINASHVVVVVGEQQQRFYIAAQGPLPNTAAAFWQMVWEQNSHVVVMLTEVREQGRDKCFPYWPQEDGASNRLEFGDFQVVRRFKNSSVSFTTSALTLTSTVLKKQRNVWHIQYTDWPDHGCPVDVQGFLSFMDEIDNIRRHASGEVPPGKSRNFPMVVHCSAGVGRSGVTMLCDIVIYCLDHNENVDVPKVLTHLRQQRMLTVQTLAQYKFVYLVLIQYLRNSRLI